jgi:hypothetical protein
VVGTIYSHQYDIVRIVSIDYFSVIYKHEFFKGAFDIAFGPGHFIPPFFILLKAVLTFRFIQHISVGIINLFLLLIGAMFRHFSIDISIRINPTEQFVVGIIFRNWLSFIGEVDFIIGAIDVTQGP